MKPNSIEKLNPLSKNDSQKKKIKVFFEFRDFEEPFYMCSTSVRNPKLRPDNTF